MDDVILITGAQGSIGSMLRLSSSARATPAPARCRPLSPLEPGENADLISGRSSIPESSPPPVEVPARSFIWAGSRTRATRGPSISR